MDIDYPEHIVERVNAALAEYGERDGVSYVVDVAGHGAAKYASVWQGLRGAGLRWRTDLYWMPGKPGLPPLRPPH